MNERILDYLRVGGPASSPFDCFCFVHSLNGLDFPFARFDLREWQVEKLADESSVKIGDTIMTGHDVRSFTHLAIYIGDGVYLSKFGVSGPLIVADIPAIKTGFGGEELFKVVPVISLQ